MTEDRTVISAERIDALRQKYAKEKPTASEARELRPLWSTPTKRRASGAAAA